jgi:Na+-translocating ferredoxin:NAD+ oxidoreductase RnfC subunit
MIATISREILQAIRDAGVVGAGGAGFPTYKKLESNVEHIIANGAECEPLLQKDRESMLQERDAMFRGLAVMREITGARKVTIAVKHKNQDVTDAFQEEARAQGFDIFVYEDVYPAGDEYILVYEITGRQIPPGGIPLNVGCVVDNVETIVNISHAIDGKPVTEKYVSVCGAVENPLTTVVPVGTSIADCLVLAGGVTVDEFVVLTGGVMMGGTTTNISDSVTKTMGGLIVLPSDHYLVQRKTQSKQTYTRIGHGQCDQCSLCTELCPRYILGYPIEPHRVMRSLLMTGEAKERISMWAQYCCECNVCSYIACPEQLDPKTSVLMQNLYCANTNSVAHRTNWKLFSANHIPHEKDARFQSQRFILVLV